MGSSSSVAWTRPPRWDPQAVAAWFSRFELGLLYLISPLRWGAGAVLGEPGLTSALHLTLTGTAAVGSMSDSWEDGIRRGALPPTWIQLAQFGFPVPSPYQDVVFPLIFLKPLAIPSWFTSLCLRGSLWQTWSLLLLGSSESRCVTGEKETSPQLQK